MGTRKNFLTEDRSPDLFSVFFEVTENKDLKTMTATLGKDAQFAAFLADPSVKKNMKADGVAGACDKLKMNVLSKNLFVAMAENGRHGLVGPVISSFNTIMAAHRGEVICTVSTAKA